VTTRRDGERGLSIMEAIVITTITALLALLIMPLLPRAAASSVDVAERGVDALDAMRGEEEFRALIRAVAPFDIDGEPQTVVDGQSTAAVLHPNLSEGVSCARAGSPSVTLAVERQALTCIGEGRQRDLLRWRGDSVGTLAYSVDGVVWRTAWSEPEQAPYVRFELRRNGRVQASWVERTMGAPP
jgi:hypothetical protein